MVEAFEGLTSFLIGVFLAAALLANSCAFSIISLDDVLSASAVCAFLKLDCILSVSCY